MPMAEPGFPLPARLACLVLAAALAARAELSACKFNFGSAWTGPTAEYPQETDYVTLWAGSDLEWNQYWIGAMLEACKPGGKLAGKTPVYYSYIIAFTARKDLNLKDCNVGSPNLCEQGADYMRKQKARILSQYGKYASETAKVWGKERPIVWLMEPDYYQYASDQKQQGGPLTYAEAGAYMGDLVAEVRKHLPNAVFSLDISPWTSNPSAWFGAFKMSDFTYINTSGGGTEAADARIRTANAMTWKAVHELTRKPILADDGYGVAGSSTGHDASWDAAANLNARIADGVVGIAQANPKSGWGSTLAAVRGQLRAIPNCAGIGLARAGKQRAGSRTLGAGAALVWKGRNALGRRAMKLPFEVCASPCSEPPAR